MKRLIIFLITLIIVLPIHIECRYLHEVNYKPDSIHAAEALISDFINKSVDKFGLPDLLNVVIENMLTGENKFLKGLSVKFNSQQCGDASFLGLNYSFKKNLSSNTFSEYSLNTSGLNFSITTEGNLILGNRDNPNDFLRSNAAFHYFYNLAGVEKVDPVIQARKTELELALADYEDKTEMKNSPEYKEYINVYSQFLKTQLYLDFAISCALESDHTFTKKQFAYTAQLGIDIKAWNVYSELSKLNIFDWPFAAIRWLNGTDKELCPLGSTIPTVLLNVSVVDPVKDETRKLIGLTKPYQRFGFEAAFKTLVSEVSGERIFFSADLRYFKEINAKDIVKQIKMDEYFYIVAALTKGEGFYVSYTYGNLPLDKKKDEVYSIGFNWKF